MQTEESRMAHNGCSRLPAFAHFESSLNTISSPLCSFEQLDLRFGPEDVGLPNTGLDLSCVNGLDLSSASYEGLNLSQQCLNLSSSGRGAQSSQSSQKQQQHSFQQPEMVLNLSTQIGLNLTRPSAMGYPMMEQELGHSFDTGGQEVGGGFGYYGDYSGYSTYPATSNLCQMEEQRASPLNLERRSSPLNLAVAPGVQGGRKRKPTPGQAQPINMVGKMMPQQGGYNHQQQDFTCNNQVFDYRIPNKLTAFYNQHQDHQSNNPMCGQGSQQSQGLVKRQQGNKHEPHKAQTFASHEYQAGLEVELAHGGNTDLFFPDLNFQHDTLQGNNFSQVQDINLNLHQTNKGCESKKGDRSSRSKLATSLGKLHQQGKGKQQSGKQIQTQDGPNLAGHNSNFTMLPTYSDINYSYTDALNFAAEALNATNNQKGFVDFTNHTAISNEKSQTNLNNLTPCSIMNKVRLFCSSCSVEFANANDLNKHMDIHNKAISQTKYSCNLCKMGFIEESQLLTHNKLQHEGFKLKPTAQKERCPQPKNLTTKKAETEVKPPVKYEPKIRSQEEIQRLKEEMAREPFPYQCVTCAKKFAERSELIQHMDDHNAMKPFKCDLCDLGFTHLSAKKRHEKTHSSEKPHQCKDCMKAFYRKSDLTTHAKTHSKPKQRHSCEQCGQMFTTENQLKEHNCSSRPSKQLRCDVCPSVLATKVEWGVHMWRHTKNASYIITSEDAPLPMLGKRACEPEVWKPETSLQPLNMQVVHA